MWNVETGCGSYKMSRMMFVFLLLIILSNDMETNPGPNTRGKQTTIEESQSQNTPGRKPPSGDMEGLWSEIHAKLGKLDQLHDINRKLDDFQSQMNNMRFMQNNLEKENTEMKKTISQLTSKVSYLERQMKRDNLVFFGIPEQQEETWDDCEDEVRKVLDENLKLKGALSDNEVGIKRAHRIGKKQQGKTRLIIVKFSTYKTKNTILNLKHKLKGSHYRISERFSEAIMQERRKFQPLIESTIQNKQRFSLKYNKLVIEGVTYFYEESSDTVKPLNPTPTGEYQMGSQY